MDHPIAQQTDAPDNAQPPTEATANAHVDCEMTDVTSTNPTRYRRPWWGVKRSPQNDVYSLNEIDMFIDRDAGEVGGSFQLNCRRGEPHTVEYQIRNQSVVETSHFGTGAVFIVKYYMFYSFYSELLKKQLSLRSFCRAIVKFTLYSTYSKLQSAASQLQPNLSALTPSTQFVLFEHDFNGHTGRFPNDYFSSNVNYGRVLKSLD